MALRQRHVPVTSLTSSQQQEHTIILHDFTPPRRNYAAAAGRSHPKPSKTSSRDATLTSHVHASAVTQREREHLQRRAEHLTKPRTDDVHDVTQRSGHLSEHLSEHLSSPSGGSRGLMPSGSSGAIEVQSYLNNKSNSKKVMSDHHQITTKPIIHAEPDTEPGKQPNATTMTRQSVTQDEPKTAHQQQPHDDEKPLPTPPRDARPKTYDVICTWFC